MMTDPYQCLRCSSIVIGVYNIIYCFIQYGVLGWQVAVVKERQWEYENRQLPATGYVDGFQARFPGLYAIYTETPERRRVNGEDSRLWSFSFFDRFRRHESSAMFAIVLICLFLCIVHFMTTTIMLYGVIKRRPGFILPFFFTGVPTVIMCTAYAVLWWSGDIFNEQLTMSVTEFVLSLGINAICIVIVLFYYYRLTGQLTSDQPRQKPPFHTNYWNYPNNSHRIAYERGTVPPWRTEWSEEPPWTLERKLRRREKFGTPVRPILGYKQGSRQSWRRSADNLYRDSQYPSQYSSQYPTPTPQPRQASTPQLQVVPTPMPTPMPLSTPASTPMPLPQQSLPSRPPSYRTRSNSSPTQVPPAAPEKTSIKHYEDQCRERRRSKRRSRSRQREAKEAKELQEIQEFLRRRSPQRVSFTKRAPKVYERTPESSIVSGPKEKHTVV